MRSLATKHNSVARDRFVALLTSVLLGLIGGCRATPITSPTEPVATADSSRLVATQVAEQVVEGSRANRDGEVTIGYSTVELSGQVADDLCKIHEAASRNDDHDLALAAAMTLLQVGGTRGTSAAWLAIARTLTECPSGLAVAIIKRLPELITTTETSCEHPLSAGAVEVRRAAIRRGLLKFHAADATYEAAQGFWDDDERQIVKAMLIGTESMRLFIAAGVDVTDAVNVSSVLAKCESDLWAGDVASARALWSATELGGDEAFYCAWIRSTLAVRAARLGIRVETPAPAINWNN
jgi:hypothetical protein